MNSLPKSIQYLIIGAGVHGLSTGWHLAKELKTRGIGSGKDILIIDKTGIAAGASGIACGVVRNFYYQYSRFSEGDLHPVSNSPYPWG